jgi:hypothetical protein
VGLACVELVLVRLALVKVAVVVKVVEVEVAGQLMLVARLHEDGWGWRQAGEVDALVQACLL